MPGLKVIALISGGKDSLFSILHCLANGHSVVALANLYPPPSADSTEPEHEADDLNSYMYQTVGHSLIPLYSAALDIPLYRQPILGAAINTDKTYAPPPPTATTTTPPDETESLLPLLQRILHDHPSANALSTGAILSTYQRTRIESVAARLGLVPLSYLWHYTSLPPYAPAALLRDMAAVGQDARIVKVASGGLDAGFLWENVAEARTVGRLERAMARFGGGGGAVLGEGGEFETVTVGGPAVLWRKRIQVEVVGSVVGEGGSAVVRLGGARVVEREEGLGGGDGMERLRRPGIWDVEFEEVLRGLEEEEDIGLEKLSLGPSEASIGTAEQEAEVAYAPSSSLPVWQTAELGNVLSISNMVAPEAGSTAALQISAIMDRLVPLLRTHNCEPSDIVFSTLLLRSMSDFTAINPIYGAVFTKPNPPARVTVACGSSLPDNVELILSVIVDKENTRRGLHVQGRSYWAPANIGPYSQAVAIPVGHTPPDERGDGVWSRPQAVYVAGQIPLVPASMDMVRAEDAGEGSVKGFKLQTTLALQHLWRIGRAMDVGWWTGAVAFISRCGREEGEKRARVAMRAWRRIHEVLQKEKDDDWGGEEVDVWDLKHGSAGRTDVGLNSAEEDGRPRLPDYEMVEGTDGNSIPPCFVVQVEELPRGADIEWTSLGLAKSRIEKRLTVTEPKLHITRILDTNSSVVFGGAKKNEQVGLIRKLIRQSQESQEPVCNQYTIYSSQALPLDFFEGWEVKLQIIPCQRIWDENGKELEVAAVVRSIPGTLK